MPYRSWPLCIAILAACRTSATDRGDTVVFASGADLQSINPLLTTHPLAHQVQRYVLLTTLVRYDTLLRAQPYLATGWTWSPDSTSLTFRLNTAVQWSDGVPTTAGDVAYTLNAARDPETGYPRLTDLADVRSVTTDNDSTLTIVYDHRRGTMPDVLTDLAILPAHILDTIPHSRLRGAAWNQAPVGNGPFRFVSHAPNRRWVFSANRGFPATMGGPPRIARLVVAVVDEPTTKLAALTSGELDFAGINPAHAAFVARDPHLVVMQYPLLFTYAVVFNTRRPPFNDLRVRQATSLAIDRSAIVDGYLFGFGTPASGPVVPAHGAATPMKGDTAAAHRALDGRPLAFELLTVGSGEAALEQMLQSQLAAIGAKVTIRQLELSTFLDRVQGPRHDFDAAVMGSSGDLDLGQLAPLLRTSGVVAAGSGNSLLPVFADSLPAAFLYHAGGLQGVNRRVLGVRLDIRGELATVGDWRIAH